MHDGAVLLPASIQAPKVPYSWFLTLQFLALPSLKFPQTWLVACGGNCEMTLGLPVLVQLLTSAVHLTSAPYCHKAETTAGPCWPMLWGAVQKK